MVAATSPAINNSTAENSAKKPVTTTSTAITTAPTPTEKPIISGIKRISIKKEEVVNTEENAVQLEKRTTPFTEEDLLNAWKKYAQKVKAQKKFSWSVTLLNHLPILKENNMIEFQIVNTPQQIEFNENKDEIHAFIKNELKNDLILIESRLIQVETIRIPQTATEKFDFLVHKNQSLMKLKTVFDADIVR